MNCDLFLVYPNPAADKFFVENFSSTVTQLELLDLLGKKMLFMELVSGKNGINVAGIPGGHYLLRLTGSEGIRIVKIHIVR